MTRSSRADLPPGTWFWLHRFGHLMFPGVVTLLVRRRVHGRDRIPATGPVVLVANHSSMLDGPVIVTVLRDRHPVFLVKEEMFAGPAGAILRRVGQIPLRRGTVDRTPLLTAVNVLRGGGLIGIFPEGTRGSGDVAQAHNGAAWLARTGNAVLLPVACRGTLRPSGARRRWRPRVDVLVGEPLPAPTRPGRAGLADATEQVRAALAALVTELDLLRGSAHTAERKVEST